VYRNNIGNTIEPNINYMSGFGLVQNNGYTISYYIEEYVNTLKTLGAPETISGRLLSQEEATSLGCSESDNWCSPVDDSNNPTNGTAASWVYSTSYWLGSAHDSSRVWGVYSDGYFWNSDFGFGSYKGVRPVIEIPTSELNDRKIVYTVNIGNEITIGSAIPSSITQYNSPKSAVNAFNGRILLKHIVENDVVTESYVGFYKNGNMYYLRGTGATYNTSTSEYNQDSIYYESNKQTLINAFGNICNENNNRYSCNSGGFTVFAYKNGEVSVYNSDNCIVERSGISHCHFFELQ